MIKRILIGAGVLVASLSVNAQRATPSCGTDHHHQEQKAQNPDAAAAERQFNSGWENFKRSEAFKQVVHQKGAAKNSAPKYIIPVVVHVFSLSKNSSENITDAQIQSEIDFLNKSFRNLNADSVNRRSGFFNGMPFNFKETAGDAQIEFRLARKDPNGNCTNGIVRVQSPFADKGNDNLKRTSVWDTKRYFNIWVVRSIDRGPGLSVAGYAQFPFYAGGAWSALTDGIMVIHNEFGNIGTSLPGQIPNVTTSTHEVGHWLGLYHPFQANDSCESQNDGVDDTPPTFFAPSTTEPLRNRCSNPQFNTCGNDKYLDTSGMVIDWDRPDMQEAFMDYFIGSCASNMFTKQQIARMHFCIENYRSKLVSYSNLVETGVLDPVSACAPVPAFGVTINSNTTYERQACVGTPINFTDLSYNGTPTSWSWNFGDGANPQTSSVANPTNVTYTTPGYKTITLTVTNANGTNTKTFTNHILINQATALNYPAFLPDYPETKDGWEFRDDEDARWQYSELGRYEGYKSIMLRGFGPGSGMYGKDYSIITPAYDFSGASAPYFNFWYSYAQNLSGTTASADELSVQYSTNCGLTWSNLRAPVIGASLATVSSQLSSTVNFVPVSNSQWKQVVILGSGIPKQPNVRFRILFSYQGGNNLFIDKFEFGLKNGIGELTSSDINLNVFPNPFTTTTQINYVLPRNADVAVEVYDVLGKKVAVLHEGKQAEGQQSLTFDRSAHGLTNGMYFVKIRIEEGTITQKVLVN